MSYKYLNRSKEKKNRRSGVVVKRSPFIVTSRFDTRLGQTEVVKTSSDSCTAKHMAISVSDTGLRR